MEIDRVTVVHEACRKKFTRVSAAPKRARSAPGAATPLSSTASGLRSAVQNFDHRQNCLICGTAIVWAATNTVSTVTQASSKVRFLNACDQRGDTWASVVRSRILGAHDLVAVGARYHRKCYSDFLKKERTFDMFRSPTSSENTSISSSSPVSPTTPRPFLERTDGTSPGPPLIDLVTPPPQPPPPPFATPLPAGRGRKGRPKDAAKVDAFLNLCSYLEQNEECQFTLPDLYSRMGNSEDSHCYGAKHLQRLLTEKYKGGIKFFPRQGQSTLYCFSGTANKILTDAWYTQRNHVECNERLRIIETAADIILEDVSSVCFEVDTFPTAEEIQDGGWNNVPRSLRTLLIRLVTRRKKGADQSTSLRKCNVIGQEIISAMRPRSYVSPLQVGLTVYIHRVFASRQLIDILSSLGKCAPYREAVQFERSVVEHTPPELLPGAFLQYAFDNADFNIRTLGDDGLNTCRITGGLAVVTPAGCVLADRPVPRGQYITAAQVAKHGALPIVVYQRPPNPGLAAMTVNDMRPTAAWDLVTDHLLKRVGVAKRMDLLWLAGTAFQTDESPSWFGFMERAFEGTPQHSVSAVIPTPFINLEASNMSAVRTALEYAVEQAKAAGQDTVPVTMDQPLFQKAAEMIVAETNDSAIRNVIISLGGFHLLMSFLGAIGYIMAGSGLSELWGTVYAPNAVVHMLTGKAFARAVRAHLLTVVVLFKMCAEDTAFTNLKKKQAAALFASVFAKDITMEQAVQDVDLKALQSKIDFKLQHLSASGRQGKLWVQYYRMVLLLLLFLRAARSADWHLHMYCIREMLPYFVASGHINYARSALLFLHLMTDLERRVPPIEYQKLVEQGYFAVFRSNKEFAGLWMDLVIEQCLMRTLKVHGGMTQGRGFGDSVKATWIKAMPASSKVVLALEKYTGERSTSSEQHVELRRSRRARDKKDREKLQQWLHAHPPLHNPGVLRCLATGTVAGPGVNAQDALEKGSATLEKLIGKDFKSIVFPRAEKVSNIKSEFSAVKIGDRLVPVNTSTLFHRITILVDSVDLPDCFAYELAPMPTSLFDENGAMRKGTKSSLAQCLESYSPCIKAVPENTLYVLDGGALLQRVVWPRPGTYRDVIGQYVRYVEKHYGSSRTTVVFDGYSGTRPSTKDCEHARRQARGTCVDLLFDEVMEAESQYKFLTNSNNKKRLIEMVKSALQHHGVAVLQAEDDADCLIVNTAISVATESGKPTAFTRARFHKS
ncbi:Glucans biosynthesis protein D [Frankliniella fusca]|uniref:Glucans biosynthesis protein D n=1 Tax=Frankliniella fusca TaxID=407009 RepID=A0AAE1I2Y2_9NEOP|nr:Glucans biosynthesis protein D [Frankliniella fusca]